MYIVSVSSLSLNIINYIKTGKKSIGISIIFIQSFYLN